MSISLLGEMNPSQIRRIVFSGAASVALMATAHASQEPVVPAKSQPATSGQPIQAPAVPAQKAKGKSVKGVPVQGGAIKMGGSSQGARKRRAPPTTEQLKQRYEEELKHPFIAKGKWVLDYDEARARAKREGKLIFAYFSRSYAY